VAASTPGSARPIFSTTSKELDSGGFTRRLYQAPSHPRAQVASSFVTLTDITSYVIVPPA
jgi:hypothetical protein